MRSLASRLLPDKSYRLCVVAPDGSVVEWLGWEELRGIAARIAKQLSKTPRGRAAAVSTKNKARKRK